MYYLLKYYDRQGNTSKININNINKKERHINTVRIIHLQVWMNIKIFETLPVFSQNKGRVLQIEKPFSNYFPFQLFRYILFLILYEIVIYRERQFIKYHKEHLLIFLITNLRFSNHLSGHNQAEQYAKNILKPPNAPVFLSLHILSD